MSEHSLRLLRVPITNRLGILKNSSHLLLLFLGQLDTAGGEVLLESMWLRRPRNRNHALCSDPRERDLYQCAAFGSGDFLDLVNDGFVLVEVLALELWDGATKVVWSKVIWALEREVIDEPAVTKGTVCT